MHLPGKWLMSATLALSLGCGPKQPDGQPPSSSVSASPADTSAGTPLVGTYWRIMMLDTMKVVSADTGRRAPHLQLTQTGDSVRYSATVGCNGVGGTATIVGENITFGPGISTKMFCEALDALERQLHSVLTATRRWTISGDTLELVNDAGTRLAVLGTARDSR